MALGPFVASSGGQFDRLYLAFASALSSTLIVVKLLSDKFELGTFGGRVTLGVLIFQDLYAIAFLAIQPNLQNLKALLLLQSLVAGAGLVAGRGSSPASSCRDTSVSSPSRPSSSWSARWRGAS